MHVPVSWTRFAELEGRANEYYDRAIKAEGTIQLLQMDGALGRLAAKLDAEEAKAAQERESSATTVSSLRQELAAKDRLIASKDRTIAGLSNQLDHALGYSPEELAILDAGKIRVTS